MTLRGQTEALLHGCKDCSAHVRARSLYDCVTAVLPEYAEPFHLRICLQRRRSTGDTESTYRSAGFDLGIMPPLPCHYVQGHLLHLIL
ncbi:hypothetical protein K469DRAFT_722234 [Zopfia rhizophila CBS 207.26]|uniref:Uncharacterized protein n=1 Tax=Zopfia rhizophila CBS 207.26 TaxID=1314779 RepID=A0A6A6DEH0_9PEZI|nr:hypothetical protein K469DRAFT_722234 [Zopfia rhizophila CBS 207.26]